MADQLMVTDNWSTKYRPKSLKQFVGQPQAVQTLTSMFERKQVPRTILISGDTGMGKTTLARIIASTVNDGIPSHKNIDVKELNAGDEGGINEIRSLRSVAMHKPQMSNFRIFIVDEAHKLTSAALGAILKILEEPPAHVVWILASNHPDKLPRELIGRCVHIKLGRVEPAALLPFLAWVAKSENVFQPAQQYKSLYQWAAQTADGQPRQALQLFEQLAAAYNPNVAVKDMLQIALDSIGDSPEQAAITILGGIYNKHPATVVSVLTQRNIDVEGIAKNAVWLNQSLIQRYFETLSYEPYSLRELLEDIKMAKDVTPQRLMEVHKKLAELADHAGYSTTGKTATMLATLGTLAMGPG